MEEKLRIIKLHTQDIKNNPNDSQNHANRGQVYTQIGDFINAIMDFDKAIELNPVPEYFYLRGMAFERIKQYDKAAEDFEQVKKDKSLVKAIQELEPESDFKPNYQF